MQLYNTLSAKERAELIEQAGKERLTVSFYAYAKIGNPPLLRNHLFLIWNELDVLGRIYVAQEGINAQLSIPADNFNEFKTHLDSVTFLVNVRLNIALEQDNFSFLKLKVKIRDKIVADGLNDDTFDVTNKGIHVGANEFNQLIEDENTILVDMRNHYESEIGRFKNAITPNVDTFRESLDMIEEDLKDHKEDKNLVMYCTGGIRCEKASAYYKHKGFKNVYQLEGGIINYVRQVEADEIENKFIGKKFCVSINADPNGFRMTSSLNAINVEVRQICIPIAQMMLVIFFLYSVMIAKKMDNCCSSMCMEVHHLPYEEQREMRKGQGNSNDIFKKGRADHLSYNKDLRNIFELINKET